MNQIVFSGRSWLTDTQTNINDIKYFEKFQTETVCEIDKLWDCRQKRSDRIWKRVE